eukprot:6608794-Alexandrium_andersonii.AAC.1
MNRLGWTAERIEARRKPEAAGLVPPWGEVSEDGYSDEYFLEDDYFDNDIFTGGEEGEGPALDAEDGEPVDSAPKRSRSGEKKVIPRRPQPSPPGHAAGDAPKNSSDAAPSDPANKSTRAEPADI